MPEAQSLTTDQETDDKANSPSLFAACPSRKDLPRISTSQTKIAHWSGVAALDQSSRDMARVVPRDAIGAKLPLCDAVSDSRLAWQSDRRGRSRWRLSARRHGDSCEAITSDIIVCAGVPFLDAQPGFPRHRSWHRLLASSSRASRVSTNTPSSRAHSSARPEPRQNALNGVLLPGGELRRRPGQETPRVEPRDGKAGK